MLDKTLHGILAVLLAVFLSTGGYVVGSMTRNVEVVETVIEKPVRKIIEQPVILDEKLSEALKFMIASEGHIFLGSSTHWEKGSLKSYPVRTLRVEVTPKGSNLSTEHYETFKEKDFDVTALIDVILKLKTHHE